MNNTEFVRHLAERLSLSVDETESMVGQFVGVLLNEISTGKVVSVQGFGNFESREKAERKMYNPTTKSFRIIPKKVTLNFKMSATLKEKVNDK